MSSSSLVDSQRHDLQKGNLHFTHFLRVCQWFFIETLKKLSVTSCGSLSSHVSLIHRNVTSIRMSFLFKRVCIQVILLHDCQTNPILLETDQAKKQENLEITH